MARRILPNLNSVNRAVQRNALKAAINTSLREYMTSQSNANLRAVNNATKALIKTYVEEHEEQQAPANVPTGNGGNGNKPLMLSNKPHTNNGNGGNQIRAIVPVGNVTPVGPNMKAPLANRGANENPRQPTAVNLNRLRGIAKNGGSNNNTILKNQTNFVNALTRNFPNHPNVKAAKNVLNARRAAKNITAGAIAAAKNKAAANAAEAARAAQAAQNAKNVKAAANAEQAAREAANEAAENARQANEAAKKIAANEAASAIEKQKAVNNRVAANQAAAAAANAAKRAAEIKSKWQRAGQGVGKAAQAASLLKAAGNARVTRRSGINAQIAAAKAMNAAYTNYMTKISVANTMNNLAAINRNIVASGNLNGPRKTNLRTTISNKQNKIAIQQKKNAGQGVKAQRALTRATQNNASLSRGSMNKYGNFRARINVAKGEKELVQIEQLLGGNTGQMFTENERRNARAAINRKRNTLKGPGPSPNAPKNGGPNNNMSKLSLSQLNAIIRLTKARLNKGQGANGNKNRLARATKLANALRPKKKGLFGHIGGAIGAVGGAAVGGVKAAGGAAKYVAAGTVHHATQAARVAAPYVKLGVRYNGQKKAPPKKIPNTKIGNNNRNRKAFNAGFGNEPWARQL